MFGFLRRNSRSRSSSPEVKAVDKETADAGAVHSKQGGGASMDESFTERTAEVTDHAEEDELFRPSSSEAFSWDILRKENSAVFPEDQRQYLRQQQRDSIQKYLFEVQRDRKECERLGITMKSRYHTRKVRVKIIDKKDKDGNQNKKESEC